MSLFVVTALIYVDPAYWNPSLCLSEVVRLLSKSRPQTPENKSLIRGIDSMSIST
jgi:hypothetical protein